MLETPGATAALVTPDRELARRVAAELRRWDIEIDNSAGVPLNRTPPGVFLRLVLDLAGERAGAGAAAGRAEASARRRRARARDVPRPRPPPRSGDPRTAAGARLCRAAGRRWPARTRRLRALCRSAGDLPRRPWPICSTRDAAPLAELAAAHVAAAERLAATDAETGVARLWRDAAGEAAARFCHELIDAAARFPAVAGPALPGAVRGAGRRHGRAAGIRPASAAGDLGPRRGAAAAGRPCSSSAASTRAPGRVRRRHDPWMSRQMRQEFGIALPERAIGIAAHDFAQALGAPEVALTRAARREGVPTVPSRWLLRLDAVLRAVGLDGALGPDPDIAAAAVLRDQPTAPAAPARPEPRPPLAARPRQLSVTQIETWIRDPYAIYARHILRLKALDELDADPGRAELGIGCTRRCAEFVRRYPRDLPLFPEAELLADRPGVLRRRSCRGPASGPSGGRASSASPAGSSPRSGLAHATSSRASASARAAAALRRRAGPFTITADRRPHRPARSGELVADRLQDRHPAARRRRSRTRSRCNCRWKARSPATAASAGSSGVPAALEYWRLSGGDPPAIALPDRRRRPAWR